jgi:hypothetical protein
MPKSHKSRHNQNYFFMSQLNFHKQKLYALIAAAIALISLLLPWVNINFLGYTTSANGIRGWGILSLIGVIGVAGLTFMTEKMMEYTQPFKNYVTICFGAIALGAVLFLLRKNSMAGGIYGTDIVHTGIGLWICLVAGLGGLAITYGLIKVRNNKTV